MNHQFDASKRVTDYKIGIDNFIKFAIARTNDSKGKIRCPCTVCGNYYHKYPDDVTLDLHRHGITLGYIIWYFHKEGDRSHVGTGTSSRNVGCTNDFYDAREMLDNFVNATGNFKNDEEPNATVNFFHKMLDSASEPIYPDNTRFTTLSFVNELL